jgi:hypothetical protein
MPHNTHTFKQLSEKEIRCQSHNFPEIVGYGETEQQARADMNRKLVWLQDNEPLTAKKNLEHRLANKLLCMCGEPLEDVPLAVYKGGNRGLVGLGEI